MSGAQAYKLKKPKSQHEQINVKPGISKILYASQQGNVDKVRKILQIEPHRALEKDRRKKSALHYAAVSDSKSSSQVADLLVMAAPDLVDNRDEDGFTPLHLAVIAGNLSLVTFLLANGADIKALDNEKHTVVHWATVCGETEALRAVLTAGAPVSTPDIHGGYPLHYAAQMCGGERDGSVGLQVLHILLEHPHISVVVEDDDGRPPLLWAASAGSAKALLALIRAGSPVEAHDKDGLTALHCAASRGHTECLDALINLCGAAPDVIDSNGCTALHYAVTLGHADATALLLRHGTDVNRQDRKGRTAAHCGCAKGQFETVKMIATNGANLWLRNARGDLPLHEAAASGRRELIKWLLDLRPSYVNARNNDGRCPLHLAALNDNADMCKVLLDGGAQVNPVLRTSKGALMTPLDCALQRGFRATAKLLQLHGGLPATRLAREDASVAMPHNHAGVSLHIRDDVTLWGDGSSSDEKKHKTDQKRSVKKRSYKRKIDYKLERTRTQAQKDDSSASEVDDGQQQPTPNQHSRPSGRQGEILIYANEVNINDRFGGVRIKQNGQVLLTDSSGANTIIEPKQMQEAGVSDEIPVKETTLPTRPKSAKYKLKSSRDGKPKEQVESPEPKPETDEIGAQIQQKSVESIDRMSFTSNTSNEDESPKEVVVEASVHSPPKDVAVGAQVNDEDKTDVQQIEEIKQIADHPVVNQTLENAATTESPSTSQDPVISEIAQPVAAASPAPELPAAAEDAEDPNQPAIKVIPPSASTIVSDQVPLDTTILHPNRTSPTTSLDDATADDATTAGSPSATTTTTTSTTTTTTKKEEVHDNIESNRDKEEATKTKTVTICEESKDMEKNTKTEKEKKQSSKSRTRHSSRHKKDSFKIVDKAFLKKRPDCEGESSVETKSSDDIEEHKSTSSAYSSPSTKEHKSFQVLHEDEDGEQRHSKPRRQRSKSEENHDGHERLQRRKIPILLSNSDRHLERKVQSSMESRVPSLPNIHDPRQSRSVSNLSAPMPSISAYSDDREESVSDVEGHISSAARKKRFFRKRSKSRGAKSAGSDYESSNLIDSGFEPSPRSSRIPKWRNMSDRGVCMTSVTQTIQGNIRRYHLERKIFQHLLDLKRLQIRCGQHNEAVLVKRAIDDYHKSCASTVGSGRYLRADYSFKSFENFLYNSLRKIQKYGAEHLRGLPENPKNPLLCTQSTYRCDHAIHAYTGVPCAAYLPKLDHHTIPKIGYDCKAGYLPRIVPKNTVTLELCHGSDKQIISLPAERLDQNKRYYVTFTVKGQEKKSEQQNDGDGHMHSKSD